MIIIDGLPPDVIATVLQYYLPDDDVLCEFPRIKKVFNGRHRKTIVDTHTTINNNYFNEYNFCTYYFKEKTHKEDGPAAIQYRKNGTIVSQSWYINGEQHNSDGPAQICYYQDENIQYQTWYINGKIHRIDGPAHIAYYRNGEIVYQSWWINGEKLTE